MKPRSLTLPASAFGVAALLIPFLRRKRKLKAFLPMLALFLLSGLLALSGCTGSVSDVKPQTPTPAGTYNVTVTGTGSYAGASYTATTNIPITVQ